MIWMSYCIKQYGTWSWINIPGSRLLHSIVERMSTWNLSSRPYLNGNSMVWGSSTYSTMMQVKVRLLLGWPMAKSGTYILYLSLWEQVQNKKQHFANLLQNVILSRHHVSKQQHFWPVAKKFYNMSTTCHMFCVMLASYLLSRNARCTTEGTQDSQTLCWQDSCQHHCSLPAEPSWPGSPRRCIVNGFGVMGTTNIFDVCITKVHTSSFKKHALDRTLKNAEGSKKKRYL